MLLSNISRMRKQANNLIVLYNIISICQGGFPVDPLNALSRTNRLLNVYEL